jgi:hypothetical protein
VLAGGARRRALIGVIFYEVGQELTVVPGPAIVVLIRG